MPSPFASPASPSTVRWQALQLRTPSASAVAAPRVAWGATRSWARAGNGFRPASPPSPPIPLRSVNAKTSDVLPWTSMYRKKSWVPLPPVVIFPDGPTVSWPSSGLV
ncbi:MAG: hypothetical protein KC656_05720 [Myxococcales bacterium]|nr:hypothetical protein [Myxococcales bacterium]